MPITIVNNYYNGRCYIREYFSVNYFFLLLHAMDAAGDQGGGIPGPGAGGGGPVACGFRFYYIPGYELHIIYNYIEKYIDNYMDI